MDWFLGVAVHVEGLEVWDPFFGLAVLMLLIPLGIGTVLFTGLLVFVHGRELSRGRRLGLFFVFTVGALVLPFAVGHRFGTGARCCGTGPAQPGVGGGRSLTHDHNSSAPS